MRSQKYRPNYTVEDYRQWQGDWELIDGIPSAMTPSPSPLHQVFAKALVTQLDNAILKQGEACGDCEVVYELDWFVDNVTVLRPDIAIVCPFDIKQPLTATPKLVVEIISPTSGLKDRHTKFGIYEEQQVPTYIVIDPIRESFNIYVLQDGKYEEKSDLRAIPLHDHCTIEIDIEKAFERIKR